MNISIVVASAPLVANGSFRSANFRNSLLDILRRVSQHSGRKIRQIASDVVREFGQLEGQA
jgi:hypothetical protein